jgi:hypothetical protein
LSTINQKNSPASWCYRSLENRPTKIYKTVFFWLGGVLTQTVAELTVAQLVPEAEGHDALKTSQRIRGLAEELALGKLASSDYCEQTVAHCEARVKPSLLKRRIVESVSLCEPIMELMAEMPAMYERWLIVDYPLDWYQDISERLEIPSLFSEDRIVVTSALNLSRMVPEIFYHLPPCAGRSMDECITIDALCARAVESMRHGLASIIYVYPERLKLELALQGIYQTEADVMHPTSSERARI